MYAYGGSLSISGCVFYQNLASDVDAAGGAIALESMVNATITDSTFVKNLSLGFPDTGGAISSQGGPLSVTDSVFIENCPGDIDADQLVEHGNIYFECPD